MLQHLLLATLCFQSSRVDSLSLSTVGAVGEAVQAVQEVIDIAGNLYVNIAKSGCWPKDIDQDAFLKEDSLSLSDAQYKIHTEILKDPKNTICERAWWFFYGWSIKCTWKAYHGIDCGSGYHYLEYSRDSYKWKDALIEELSVKDARTIAEMVGEKQEDEEMYKRERRMISNESLVRGW